ncbi:50S ribosomal protein L29 [Candidatus Daviesbacteria bacterium]|nr:50S ribosomal protein L29 [Candidatus Daviesbacteria bacterium]
MKKNELTQIKGLDVKELKEKITAFKKEIADLTMDKNMKKLQDLKQVNKKKKDLARVLTILRQKEQLSVLSSQLSGQSKSVVGQSEDRKPQTDNRKNGGRK